MWQPSEMFQEFLRELSDWSSIDTRALLAAVTTAMVCALPGVWLVLRRQSMLGDALSHTVLPGIVGAFLVSNWLTASGGMSFESAGLLEQGLIALGAAVAGVVTAMLTEVLTRWGRIEPGAALGVVFSSLFALGLLLIRLMADQVHIEPDCVLFGELELAILRTCEFGPWRIPRVVVTNLVMFGLLLGVMLLGFKELQVSSFDPEFAGSLGLRTGLVQQLFAAMTALAVVTAFRTVGSILVIALLVGPPLSGRLMSQRLGLIVLWSLGCAVAAVTLGLVLAKGVPPVLFPRLGFESVQEAGASGMIAVACGLVFCGVLIIAPGEGVLVRLRDVVSLRIKVAAEDILGHLYRSEERAQVVTSAGLEDVVPRGLLRWLALRQLLRGGLARREKGRYLLSDSGRESAGRIVRSHRLWESYMALHFDLPAEHLHETAHSVEHFVDPSLASELTEELDRPALDPHGTNIPPATQEGKPAEDSPPGVS